MIFVCKIKQDRKKGNFMISKYKMDVNVKMKCAKNCIHHC